MDCGSGIMQFLRERKEAGVPMDFDVLISHIHIDHIVGLSMFQPFWDAKNRIRVFTKSRDERPLAEQVLGIFRPPYWPIDLVQMNRAEFIAINEDQPFSLSETMKVTPFWSNHPDDTVAFRIDADKSLVYLSDFEDLDDADAYAKVARVCEGADMILYDSAYMPEDYPNFKTYGHSTFQAGVALAEDTRCKRMIFIHLDHRYSDKDVDAMADKIAGYNEKYFFARDGLEMEI